MDLSDHSESDEDYDPTKDAERDKDEEEGAEIRPLEGALKRVSRKRANAAEDVFNQLNGEEKASLKALKARTALVMTAKHENDSLLGGEAGRKKAKKSKGPAKVEKREKLLAKVFGSKSKASSIISGLGKYELVTTEGNYSSSSGNRRGKASSKPRAKGKGSSSSSSNSSSSSSKGSNGDPSSGITMSAAGNVREKASTEITAAVRASLGMIARKTLVTETRKFAGQEITIEKSEMAVKDQFAADDKEAHDSKGPRGTSSRSSSSSSSGGGGALDSVIDTIKGPKAISTVTKSAFDWQSHKAKEGLDDELAPAAKDGYLARQDFLVRVDHRTYEKERDERLRQQTTTRSQV